MGRISWMYLLYEYVAGWYEVEGFGRMHLEENLLGLKIEIGKMVQLVGRHSMLKVWIGRISWIYCTNMWPGDDMSLKEWAGCIKKQTKMVQLDGRHMLKVWMAAQRRSSPLLLLLSRPPPVAETTTTPVYFYPSDIFCCRFFLASLVLAWPLP